MTKNEAVLAAEAFVSRKYAHLPGVVSVAHVTVRGDRLYAEAWTRSPGAVQWRVSAAEWDESRAEDAGFGDAWRAQRAAAGEQRGFTGQWTVYFFMSWDTDALGMPQTLCVSVDDSDGTVRQVTPD